MECGLDGGPGISDCSWGVVRVGEQEFNELLSMKTRSSGGLKDEWDQVDAGISVEFFLFLTFGRVVIRSAMHLASAEWHWSTPPPLLHTMQWSWCRLMEFVQTRLAALTFGHVGEMLVARAAAGCASISRRAIETWKHLSSAS